MGNGLTEENVAKEGETNAEIKNKEELINIIYGAKKSKKTRAWLACKGELTKEDLLLIIKKCRHRSFINNNVWPELRNRKLSGDELLFIIKRSRIDKITRREAETILKRDFPGFYASLIETKQLEPLTHIDSLNERRIAGNGLIRSDEEMPRESETISPELNPEGRRGKSRMWTPPWELLE